MSKRKTWIIGCAVFLLLAAAWSWRYVTMNAYYDSISLVKKETYAMHETVPFGKDWLQDACADGYEIEAKGFEIVDYEPFLQSAGLPEDINLFPPEKLALVHVTLYNRDSNAEGVMLIDLLLKGVDSIAGMDWDILTALNPILEGNYGICLPIGTECDLILPYDLFRSNFGSSTWRNIKEYDFSLAVTIWPTEKRIRLESESKATP